MVTTCSFHHETLLTMLPISFDVKMVRHSFASFSSEYYNRVYILAYGGLLLASKQYSTYSNSSRAASGERRAGHFMTW